MKVNKFNRGQVWWYHNNTASYDGSIQGKSRPVIIISNNIANSTSNCLIGVPCTTAQKRDMPTHTSFDLNGTSSTALAENLISLNVERLGSYIGTLDNELLKKVEKNVKVALGFCEPELVEVEVPENLLEPESIVLTIASAGEEVKPTRKRLHRTIEEKIRYCNDFENHDIHYMIKKYDEVSAKAVQNKYYRYRSEVESK